MQRVIVTVSDESVKQTLLEIFGGGGYANSATEKVRVDTLWHKSEIYSDNKGS